VPRIATSAHLLGTSLGKAREGVAPLDTLAPMQEVDEEQIVGIGVSTAGPALRLASSPSVSPVRGMPGKPSGLSRLIAGGRSRENSANAERREAVRSPIAADGSLPGEPSSSSGGEQSGTSEGTVQPEIIGERAGLLGGHVRPSYGALPPLSVPSSRSIARHDDVPESVHSPERRLTWKSCRTLVQTGAARAKELATPGAVKVGLTMTATALPAVVLGMLLNILDGVSYGVRSLLLLCFENEN
jgi:hypothetical protein